ncbi:MAG: alpha/beta hydrolase [Anaerolineae bacterium]|nr:alpha/beta hydrolase [Anaerolineae bacterium]
MTLSGTLHRHADFAAAFVPARTLFVWLPPGYDADASRRFPVIYMHDGQNLFDPAVASGFDWGVDEAMTRLIEAGETRGAIAVGMASLDARRLLEYMPHQALSFSPSSRAGQAGGEVLPYALSDPYLRFIVEEVKPFVDTNYRTLPEREHTFVMGSSMGGLISLYAVCEYPGVFRGAGCLSTHWPAGDGIVIDYLRRALPAPGSHRFYFDFGTETLDAEYEPYQHEADAVMRAAGYREGVDWITLKFQGAEHSERAWRERVHIPFFFLLEGKRA